MGYGTKKTGPRKVELLCYPEFNYLMLDLRDGRQQETEEKFPGKVMQVQQMERIRYSNKRSNKKKMFSRMKCVLFHYHQNH